MVLAFRAGYSQFPSTRDSLEVFLKTQKQDTTYILALNAHAFLLVREGDFDKADREISKIQSLSEKLDYGTGFYKAENMRGVVEYSKQQPKKAMQHFLKCNEIIQKYKLPKNIYQNSLNNISLIYGQMGDRQNATEYAMELIALQEKHKLEPLKTGPYDQIGDNLKFYGRYEEALKYYQKSLDIETRYGNGVNMAIGENRIGNLRESMGNPSQAKEHFQKALKLARKANYKLLEAEVLINLGRMLRLGKKYGEAETCLAKSVKLSRQLESAKTRMDALEGLGTIYLEQNQLDKAQQSFEEALQLGKDVEDPEFTFHANNNLAELFEKKGDFKKAFYYQNAAVMAKDSMFHLETAKNTEELLRKYESERKEQEIALLNAKNEKASLQNKALVGGGILLLLLGGITVFYVLSRNELKRIEESQKLRNRIASDLHDEIGSTLSSIMLISDMAKKQEGEGQRMFSKINSDSKSVMESVDEIIWSVSPMNDSLPGVLVRLREYAQPLAESKKIDLEWISDPKLEKVKPAVEVRKNLYLIVKEAINNLAKYSGASKAFVRFSLERKTLKIEITDNGKGFDINEPGNRNGLKNMQKRSDAIQGKLEIRTGPGRGTSVLLRVLIA